MLLASERIRNLEEDYKNYNYAEHEQILHFAIEIAEDYESAVREAMVELNAYRKNDGMSENVYRAGYKCGYNKAINDFVNRINEKFPNDKNGLCNIEIIAKSLKLGDANAN